MEVGKVTKRDEATPTPFFFFFFLFTFETTEICFLAYQNGNFLPGKSISRREQNQENDFAPSEKYACYTPEC